MQNIESEIRKIFYKHFPTLTNDSGVRAFVDELSILVLHVISQTKDQGGAVLTIRELEEILVSIREFKEFYEKALQQTTQDVLKLDELKQLEYKLTEKILTNR